MAADSEKIKQGVLSGLLRQMDRGGGGAFESAASEASAKAREGKGFIRGTFAATRARQQVAKEYTIATKGTLGKRQAFFEALLGKDLGDLFKNLGLEKMESPEKIKEARQKFKLDKKDKGEKSSGVGKLAKPLSIIIRKVIETQKMVQNIERSLSKPSLKSGYTFDPRMAGGGRYKNAEGKLVSSKEVMEKGPSARTSALTAAINADEQPLVKLREYLEDKFKDFDAKKLKKSSEDTLVSLNGVTPTLGLLSVHDKLNMILAKSALGGVGGLGGNVGRNRRGVPGNRRGRGGGRGLFGGVGALAGAAAGGFLAYKAVDSLRDPDLEVQGGEALKEQAMIAKSPEEKKVVADQIAAEKKDIKLQAAATGAGGAGAVAGAVAVKKVAQTAVVKNVKSKMWSRFLKFVEKQSPKLWRLVGKRLALAGGMALVPGVGWVSAALTVVGSLWMAYDLYQLWQEFSALSDAEQALYDEKTQKQETTEKGKPQKKPEAVPAPLEPVSGASPTPISAASTNALPGAGTVAMATTTAAAIPAAAGGAAAPSATPRTSSGPERRLGPAAAKRGKISSSEGRNAALAAASKAGITGPHLAQFMAQLDHESNGFTAVEENLRYSAKRLLQIFPKYYKDPAQAEADAYSPMAIANRVYANRMGNGPPESGDGYKYRGRGLIQLTGKDNYKRFGQMAGIDLVSNPDLAGNLGTAADIAAAFYKKNVIDKGIPGENTAKVTKAINGGSIGLSHRESLFASYSKDASALQPTQIPSGGDTAEEPSMVAKGQDVKVGGDASGGPAPVKQQPMVASYGGSTTPSASVAAAETIAPVQNTTGTRVAQGSAQLETSKMTAQAMPAAPVVINNQSGSQQPIAPPKQPVSKASSRSNENSFNRALANDFSHPTAFTSVAPV